MKQFDVCFISGNTPYRFSIFTNLQEDPSMYSAQQYFNQWIKKTKQYTAASFCKYIRNTGYNNLAYVQNPDNSKIKK